MEIKKLDTWDDFEAVISSLMSPRYETGKISYSDQYMFRGQANEKWGLSTTLDRDINQEISCLLYESKMRSAKKAIASQSTFVTEISEDSHKDYLLPPINLSLMVYLRQNGFPSPLLDWSQSPYVAAYFAFCERGLKDADRVAIYSYQETKSGTKIASPSEPTVIAIGPWIETDKKHYLQQSRYTICRQQNNSNQLIYANHEEAFSRGALEQDRVVKYTLPITERAKVLRRLRVMNVTRYSLFEDVNGLMDLVAMDVFNL